MGQRLQIIREIKEGKQKSKAAQEYGVGTSYITKLMKPENIAALEKRRELDLSQDANRAVAPKYGDLEARLNAWIKIARARFAVRTAVIG